MEIKTHKLTGQKMRIKKDCGGVSSVYILDENENLIPDGCTVTGEKHYKTAVVITKNLK